jgi:plastocyanin
MRTWRLIVLALTAGAFIAARPAWAGGLTAECTTTHTGDRVEVAVAVENATGATITAVTPAPLTVTPSRGATLMVLTAPHPWRELLRNKSVTFKWKARVDGTGTVAMSTTVTAIDAAGAPLSTGIVSCAPLMLTQPHPTPTPTPTPTPVLARPHPTATPTHTSAADRLRPRPTPRPTRTATRQTSPTPARTDTPLPCPERGRFAAHCWIAQRGGYGTIFVRAENGTRGTLTSVTATLAADHSIGATLRVSAGTKTRNALICNNGVTFKWRARARGNGSVAPSVEVTARDAQGRRLSSGIVACGSLRVAPSATRTPAGFCSAADQGGGAAGAPAVSAPDEVAVGVGRTIDVSADGSPPPSAACKGEYTWESDDDRIGKVAFAAEHTKESHPNKATITGGKPGQINVTVTYKGPGGKPATHRIRVSVFEVKFDPAKVQLAVGETTRVTAEIQPGRDVHDASFQASDSQVASRSEPGSSGGNQGGPMTFTFDVTGNREGTTEIQAGIGDVVIGAVPVTVGGGGSEAPVAGGEQPPAPAKEQPGTQPAEGEKKPSADAPEITVNASLLKVGLRGTDIDHVGRVTVARDLPGILEVGVTPKSAAGGLEFKSSNPDRIAVEFDPNKHFNSGENTEIFRVLVKGISATPAEQRHGDANVQVLFRSKLQHSVPVLVVVPKTRRDEVGEAVSVTNSVSQTAAGTTLKTKVTRIVRITILDQFGDALSSVYDGLNVAVENLSEPGGKASELDLSVPDRIMERPDSTLTSGVKLDEVSVTDAVALSLDLNTLLPAGWSDDWGKQKSLPLPEAGKNAFRDNRLNPDGTNAVSMNRTAWEGSLVQKLFINGHHVGPDIKRTMKADAVDDLAAHYKVADEEKN